MSDYSFIIGESEFKVSVKREGDTALVKIADELFTFQAINENLLQVTHNNTSQIVASARNKGIVYVDIDGTAIEVQSAASFQDSPQAQHHHAIKDRVFAPMPGKIVKILVQKGDTVASRQPLAVVEAMKMENQIASPADGKIKAINFSVGDQVNTTSPIIELELAAGQ
jgi:biotin carboxyl carrier protein